MKASFEKNDLKIMIIKADGINGYLPMFHSHMEFIYVLEGNISMCIDGKNRVLSKGEMSIVFPYTVHSYEKTEDIQAVIILFSPESVGLFKKECFSLKPENPYLENAEEFLYIINQLVYYTDRNEKMTLAYLNTIVGEILNSVKLVKTENVDITSVQQILIYCSEHFREDISVKKIAKDLYISESNVSKIFSHKIGYSFREYINSLRISEAKKLLKNTDAKITDIMYSVGYENQSSFNRVFLEEAGMTPGEYKKQK